MLPRSIRRLCAAPQAGRLMSSRSMATAATAVRYHRHGDPARVLKVESVEVPDKVGDDEVLVQMLAAPITVSDLSKVAGFQSSGVFPATAGNEGVGQALKVGKNVKDIAVNDWVVPGVSGVGTWATHVVAPAEHLCKVEKSGSVEQAAVSVVSPALAHCLLKFAELEEGDVVIQNNAASTVGQVVQQLAAERGLVVVNVMRDHPEWEELSAHFQGLNPAGITVSEQFARSAEFPKLLKDLPAPKLALDGTGGAMSIAIARALRPGGTMVTYGNVSKKPVTLPMDLLLDRGIVARGFNLDTWARRVGREKRNELIRKVTQDVAAGKLKQLVAWEPFADFNHALKRATKDYERKVVLVMNPKKN